MCLDFFLIFPDLDPTSLHWLQQNLSALLAMAWAWPEGMWRAPDPLDRPSLCIFLLIYFWPRCFPLLREWFPSFILCFLRTGLLAFSACSKNCLQNYLLYKKKKKRHIHYSAHGAEHPLLNCRTWARNHSLWELSRRAWLWSSRSSGQPLDLLCLWNIYLCSVASFLFCEMMVPASSLIFVFCLFVSSNKGKTLGCQEVSSSNWDEAENGLSYLFVSGRSSS